VDITTIKATITLFVAKGHNVLDIHEIQAGIKKM
jgi:hypothetical protein